MFGSTGKGGLSLIDVGGNTLVRGNIDNSAAFEFEILIVDGAVSASAYTVGRLRPVATRRTDVFGERSFGRRVLDRTSAACGRPDHPPDGEKLVA